MNVQFSRTAWDQYLEWQSENEKTVERINDLIKAIQRDPFKGIGKLEPLRQNLKGFWSRRISKVHRIVYRIVGTPESVQRIEILTCKFHY